MQNPQRFSALYVRDFRLFWFGQWISLSGTWMHVTAQAWLVYELTHSPLYLGIVSAASALPMLIFSLPGGALADRITRRSLLIITQALSIIPALLIGLLTTTNLIRVEFVIALAFILGLVNSFDIPARQTFFMDMVGKERLLSAIALNSASFNGARMIGPLLAGIIIANFSVAACFYINAASYLATVATLSLVRARGERSPGEKRGVLSEIHEGITYIRHTPEVLRPILLVLVFSLCSLPFTSQLPVFAEDIFGTGARGLGQLLGASGAGAFTAAILLSFLGDIENKPLTSALSSLAFPLLLMAFSLSRQFELSLVLMYLAGLSVVAFLATANSTLQLGAPDALRGRVISVYILVFLGVTPLGHLLMGSLSHSLGSALAIRITSAVGFAVSLLILMVMKR